jgi:hypothetical protein
VLGLKARPSAKHGREWIEESPLPCCPAALNAVQASRSASIAAKTIEAMDLIHLQS